MTKQQSKWNADAEAALMGFTVSVESEEHLKHLVGYIVHTLNGMLNLSVVEDDKTSDIVNKVTHNYNSKHTPVSYFTVSSTYCGTMLTFVRDSETKNVTSTNGVLAWVENLEYPDCSELGYVYFKNVNGKIKRVA